MKTRYYAFKFSFKGKKGSVRVLFGANRGAKSSGFTAIGAQFTGAVIRGFPVMKAEVKYAGMGYEAILGWVQIVTHKYPGGAETEASVDIAPQFQDYSVPYCCYGYKPTLYDAPSHNPGITMDWTAYTFLCPVKLVDPQNKKMIAPVVGFSWGYSLAEGKLSSLRSPEAVKEEKWAELSQGVKDDFRDWTFGRSYVGKEISSS